MQGFIALLIQSALGVVSTLDKIFDQQYGAMHILVTVTSSSSCTNKEAARTYFKPKKLLINGSKLKRRAQQLCQHIVDKGNIM